MPQEKMLCSEMMMLSKCLFECLHFLCFAHLMLDIFCSFDLGLEKCGVNVDELKKPAMHGVFCAWVEDWEEERMLKDDIVSETRVLKKCKNLVFHNPDQDMTEDGM